MDNGSAYEKPKKRRLRNLVSELQSAERSSKSRSRLSLPCLPQKESSSSKTTKKRSKGSRRSSKCTWLFRKSCYLGFCYVVYLIFSNKTFLEDLKQLSINQYYLYMHGRKHYCEERFDYEPITRALRSQLYGQEDAVREIEGALRAHENVTGIVLYGPQGVGKTLTASLIKDTFQWPSNIQQIFWSNVESKSNKLQRSIAMLSKLSSCAQNAIFIDDGEAADADIVREFHEILRSFCETKDLKTFAFYVIRKSDEIENQKISLEAEDRINLAEYRNFREADLLNCIEIECRRFGIDLSPAEVTDVIESIRVEKSGCKNVAAKIKRLQMSSGNGGK